MERPTCPACGGGYDPAAASASVCVRCAASYAAELGPNWEDTPTGQFLLASNAETARMDQEIACSPPSAPVEMVSLEQLAVDTTIELGGRPRSRDAAQIVAALAVQQGWGAKRIHAFLARTSYPLSLSTIKRRLREVRAQKPTGV